MLTSQEDLEPANGVTVELEMEALTNIFMFRHACPLDAECYFGAFLMHTFLGMPAAKLQQLNIQAQASIYA